MLKKEIIDTKNGLLQFLKEKKISVSKIVVFGSFAEGRERKDSDIDIIIVSKNFRHKSIFEKIDAVKGIHRSLVRRVKRPFDIMYYSDVEWKEENSFILNAAKHTGKIIYG